MTFDRLKPFARHILSSCWGGADRLGLLRCSLPPVIYVVERGESWSIRWDGEYYAKAVNKEQRELMAVEVRPERLAGRIAHFGSQFVWELWTKSLHPSNRQLVTFFHGKPDDGPEMARHIDFFMKNNLRADRIITAAGLIERRLLSWGVPRERLVKVPLGVDPVLFHPPSPEERRAARQAFSIPNDRICIGSFQKDGIGWGEGHVPKLIKGPDLFVETVAKLSQRLPIFVLLTGPARGYVRDGLERHGISYTHVFLKDYQQVAQAYHGLDLYLMTSREEGGPKALLECLAVGVPLVTTRVGMADDLFSDPKDARCVDVNDVDGLVAAAENMLGDESLRKSLAEEGRRLACAYDWQIVGKKLYKDVYRPLLLERQG